MLLGVTYRGGADFTFTPKPLKKTKKPSISIIGTGKRVGKTAVSGFVARTLKEVARPVVVTMGRGGPEEPELIEGEKIEITPPSSFSRWPKRVSTLLRITLRTP